MEPLRFGIIGFGYFGKYHARILSDIPGTVLSAVASPHISEDASGVLGAHVKRMETAEDLLRDEQLDCVIIATPPSTHLGLAKQAALAKKNILIEKPAIIEGELEEFRSIFENYPKCLMVGHIYFYNEMIEFMKTKIEEGLIGAVKQAFFRQMAPGPIRNDTSCLWEMGPHHLSVMEYLFGPARIVEVSGSQGGIGKKKDDYAAFDVKYSNNISLSSTLSWLAPRRIKEFIVIGDRGAIAFDDIAKKVTFTDLYYPLEPGTRGSSVWFTGEEKEIANSSSIKNPQQKELEHFVECIRKGKEPLTGQAHMLRVAEQLETISKAIKRDL